MKVTTKGQVTIPARIRDYLAIAPHSQVEFRIAEGAVVLVKRTDRQQGRSRYESLRGILKGGRTTRQWMQATRGG